MLKPIGVKEGVWVPLKFIHDPELGNTEKAFLIEVILQSTDNVCTLGNRHFCAALNLSNSRVSIIISSLTKNGFISSECLRKGRLFLERRLSLTEKTIKFGIQITYMGPYE